MDIQTIKKELKSKGRVIIRSFGTIKVYKRKVRTSIENPKMVTRKVLSIRTSRVFLRDLNKKK